MCRVTHVCAVGEQPSTDPKLLRQEAASVGDFDKNTRYLTCKAPCIVLNYQVYVVLYICVTKMRRGQTLSSR